MTSENVTKYRSSVGKLLYISPDRPDVQFVAQGLASLMQRPTKRASCLNMVPKEEVS